VSRLPASPLAFLLSRSCVGFGREGLPAVVSWPAGEPAAAAPGVAACPVCAGHDVEGLGVTANGPLVRCAHCTLTYHPRLAHGAQPPAAVCTSGVAPYYGDDAAYEDYRRRRQARWEDLFARLRRYQPGGRLLDVGCARGYSTAVACKLGFAASGVELSAADARYAREHLGLPVYTGTVEQAPLEQAGFDAVVMWSVLEHVAAPHATVGAVARILRPGGILNIFTPNAAGKAARRQGLAWIEYNRAGHAALYSPAALRRLLMAHGLQPVEMYTTLWGAHSSGDSASAPSAIRRWVMRPALAPLRAQARRMIGRLAPRAAAQGEYLGVYARKGAAGR